MYNLQSDKRSKPSFMGKKTHDVTSNIDVYAFRCFSVLKVNKQPRTEG